MAVEETYRFEHAGFCPICETQVIFQADGPYFRNTLKCPSCGSAPRARAVANVLEQHFPMWRSMRIHECSPANRGISAKMQRECPLYVGTHYNPSVPFGSIGPHGYRSEDLEAQTFDDGIFDLVVTQDVFEHLLRPDLAIKEIARTLKPGGAHICTVPMVRKHSPSIRRAELISGKVHHLVAKPEYHGNPIDPSGSLVTVAWGYDLAGYLAHHSQLIVTIVDVDNIDKGIRADLNEVLVCRKLPVPHI